MRAVPLSRIAWLVTVAACVIAAVLLLVASYQGYAALAVAVGASAAINLR
jgi:negative regulator of sigma E activity